MKFENVHEFIKFHEFEKNVNVIFLKYILKNHEFENKFTSMKINFTNYKYFTNFKKFMDLKISS